MFLGISGKPIENGFPDILLRKGVFKNYTEMSIEMASVIAMSAEPEEKSKAGPEGTDGEVGERELIISDTASLAAFFPSSSISFMA